MAGCAFAVSVRVVLGPSSIILESLKPMRWSISSTIGFAVVGKASSHGLSMPTFCTPWPEGCQRGQVALAQGLEGCLPGKNIAVRGRDTLLDLFRTCDRVFIHHGCKHLLLTASSMSDLRWRLLNGLGRPCTKHFIARSKLLDD